MDKPVYPITVFYDGACGICRREMERYRAKDKNARLKFVNVNRPDFDAKSEGLDTEKIFDYLHAKDGGGRMVRGVEAFVWIWMACGYGILPVVAQLPIVKQLARASYRLFARYRYKIGGEELVCGPECNHTLL
jgi:predicted DCC family thiol-disulfide oxidoreductase YuxK